MNRVFTLCRRFGHQSNSEAVMESLAYTHNSTLTTKKSLYKGSCRDENINQGANLCNCFPKQIIKIIYSQLFIAKPAKLLKLTHLAFPLPKEWQIISSSKVMSNEDLSMDMLVENGRPSLNEK